MGSYGGKTPKRHIAWSSSSKVGLLNPGKLKGWDYKSEEYQKHRTATIYSKGGKKKFHGNKKQLKSSQKLGSNSWLVDLGIEGVFVYIDRFDGIVFFVVL